MKAFKSYTVRPRLPEPLAALRGLSMNLRWSWDARTQDLFRWVDPDVWEATGRDPVKLLAAVGRQRLDALASDRAFLGFLREVNDDLQRDLNSDRWFDGHASSLRSVAYFSPEFGIAQALPQYSGGLGVLAGDHLKAASGLGVPLTGIGLFYHQGYFRQELNGDGWQEERYVDLDPHAMALTPSGDIRVEVDLAGVALLARIWKAKVGRISLYILDSSVEENDEEHRMVTNRLYGGDSEHRLRQEILLGIGGVRALDAVGEMPQVFHTNEGHAGFLGLERVRRHMVDGGLTFEEAVEATRAGTVFTTHTPVPAGMDRFPRALMERYFKTFAASCDIDFEALMRLGHQPGEGTEAPFNMAVMGMRLSGLCNGVSRLHGAVSRQLFQTVWPDVPVDELPIGSVTNGVHARTWVSPELATIFDRHVLPEWHDAGPDRWVRVDDIGDDELWRARQQARERLVSFARQRLRASVVARGGTEVDTEWCDTALDPAILTIGFARRFAPYKRATLLLSQPERLSALLLSADRPVQLLFAGKAHPADNPGKDLIRQVAQFARRPELRHRIAFLEDYDIALAQVLYQGCDVWLNTPRRPMEACGTSGEKAALNGSLNCSILDGWWDELYDGQNGWAIRSAENHEDQERRDRLEAESLFDILERQIVPMFYDAAPGRPPHHWLTRVRNSLRTLGPVLSASRMVREYTETMYEPAAVQADALGADAHRRARELSAWKARVAKAWPKVSVVSVDGGADALADLGARRPVTVEVHLGDLEPSDVAVQLVHGPVAVNDDLSETSPVTLDLSGPAKKAHRFTYQGSFACERPGRYGFTARIIPSHPDLLHPNETGLVTWA